MAELRRVQGLSVLRDRLRAFPDKLRKKVLGAATRAAATPIRDEARRRAPEWTGPVSKGHPPPGTLKKEIIYKRFAERCTDSREVYAVLVRRRRMKAYYWWWVEFGSANNVAKHYLRDAFREKQQAAIDAFAEKLKAGVAATAEELKR